MNKSKRVLYFDVIRIIAIIGIIFCHSSVAYVVMDMGTPNFYISAFFDCFRDFSVPIFVMLSGALLIGKKDSLITFFKKRLSRIFIPFIFWVFISIIYSFTNIKHSIDINNAIDIFLGHGGTMGVAFWFIWMIIIVYIGIFIINKILEFGNAKIDGFDEKFPSILALLSVIYIICFQFRFLSPIFYESLIIYYFSFVCYAIIGYFLANTNYLESKIKANKLFAIFALLSSILYLNYIINYVVPTSILKNHFTYLGYFNIQIMLISVCVFLMFKFLSYTEFFKKIENSKYEDLIVTLSRYSYGIYLCHYIILFQIKRSMVSIIPVHNQNSIIMIPLLVLLTLIGSTLILYILNRIPYLNKITGIN